MSISLVYRFCTSDHIFEEYSLDPLSIRDRECTNKVYHGFFREFVWAQLDIDITELLLIVMVAEYAIDDSAYILFFIIDTDFDLIASSDHRINKKWFR